MLSEELKIQEWIKLACERNNLGRMSDQVKYKFNKRFTRIAGQAHCQKKMIELSEPLWLRSSSADKRQVVIHETCHILAYHKFGNTIEHHGDEWKSCMRNAGLKPDRCHTIDRTGLRKQYVKYAVRCKCTITWFGHVKAAQVRKSLLFCTKCNQKVYLTGQEHKPINF